MIALVDQGVVTVDDLDCRIALVEWLQIWVVLPEIGTGGPDVCNELVGMTKMEVSDRGIVGIVPRV
jgi:hypothetical protein